MAKRKDSVALFEVIKAQKSREKAAAAAGNPEAAQPAPLRTPKWWFKRSPGSQPQQQIAGPDPFAAPALPPPAQAPMPVSSGSGEYSPDVDPTMSRSAAALVQRVVPAASPERVTIPGGVDPFGLDPSPQQAAPARRPAARSWLGFGPAKKVGIDPDRKEVTVRLRYTTAIIAGFAVCVVIGLAYLSGRSSSRASAGANGITSEQVRRGPILAGVLDVQAERTTISEAGAETRTATTPEAPNNVRVDPPMPEPRSAGNEAPRGGGPTEGAVVDNPPPALPVTGDIATDLPRHNGLNYVVIQSYPEKKDADAAKEALLAAGIPCTVQRPPTGWDQKLWAVIGTYGFPRTNTMPQYKRYLERINAVGKNFAGKSKYRSFDPSPVKWKDS